MSIILYYHITIYITWQNGYNTFVTLYAATVAVKPHYFIALKI